jgi:hypothetical protein
MGRRRPHAALGVEEKMRTLIAIASLVASVSASAGELDGKNLVCTSDYDGVVGIEFTGGKAIRRFITGTTGTVVSLHSETPSEYLALNSEVRWDNYNRQDYYAVDRKTLKHIHQIKRSGIRYGEWDCELSSRDAMMDALNNAVLLEQKKIDEEMKDNKI